MQKCRKNYTSNFTLTNCQEIIQIYFLILLVLGTCLKNSCKFKILCKKFFSWMCLAVFKSSAFEIENCKRDFNQPYLFTCILQNSCFPASLQALHAVRGERPRSWCLDASNLKTKYHEFSLRFLFSSTHSTISFLPLTQPVLFLKIAESLLVRLEVLKKVNQSFISALNHLE